MKSVPHIYLSALSWLPESVLSQTEFAKSFKHLPLISHKEDRKVGMELPIGEDAGSVVYSPDGCLIAALSLDTVHIYNSHTGKIAEDLGGHRSFLKSVVFSPDSRRIASGSRDGSICIWNIETTDYILGNPLEGHSGWVRSVCFSPDSNRVASGSDDNTVKIWDTATGACVQTLKAVGRATQLSFSKGINSRLYTNLGTLDLDLESSINIPLTEVSSQHTNHYGYGIDSTNIWIVKDGKPMLWLPPEYRPETFIIAESMVAIGCRSGRVLVMQFSE